jgi:hypothetical protein
MTPNLISILLTKLFFSENFTAKILRGTFSVFFWVSKIKLFLELKTFRKKIIRKRVLLEPSPIIFTYNTRAANSHDNFTIYKPNNNPTALLTNYHSRDRDPIPQQRNQIHRKPNCEPARAYLLHVHLPADKPVGSRGDCQHNFPVPVRSRSWLQ